MAESVSIKELEANPYRGLEHYPIQPQKVAHLKESVQATGLWPRLMGRRRDGKVQIAYGHHLKAALEELYGPSHKIEIEIREFSDSQMFQMMARENMSEWDTTPIQDVVTVQELLAAISRGEIRLPPSSQVKSSIARLRDADTTAEAMSRFLGWSQPNGHPSNRFIWIMNVLELMDAKLLKLRELEGLGENQVAELIGEINRRKQSAEKQAQDAEDRARQAREEAKVAASAAEKKEAEEREEYEQKTARTHREYVKTGVRTIVKEIGSGLREGKIATRDVRSRSSEILPPPFPPKKKIPEINQFAHTIASELDRVLGKNDPDREKLLSIFEYQNHLDPFAKEMLVGSLRHLAERVNHWIERFDSKNNGAPRTPVKSAGPRQLT